jgi:hypothetical protein
MSHLFRLIFGAEYRYSSVSLDDSPAMAILRNDLTRRHKYWNYMRLGSMPHLLSFLYHYARILCLCVRYEKLQK